MKTVMTQHLNPTQTLLPTRFTDITDFATLIFIQIIITVFVSLSYYTEIHNKEKELILFLID